MKKLKRPTPEQIVENFRDADVMLAAGKSLRRIAAGVVQQLPSRFASGRFLRHFVEYPVLGN